MSVLFSVGEVSGIAEPRDNVGVARELFVNRGSPERDVVSGKMLLEILFYF